MKTFVRCCALLAVASLIASAAPSLAAVPAHGGPRVTQRMLANGLRVVVIEDRVAPVVSVWLNVHAGADDEAFTGLAHAQEHMFYRGSASLSGAQADEIAGFTGDEDNADTQQILTQFFHTVPSADLDLAIHLDASRFSGLLDAQSDWDQERGAIEQEVSRDNGGADYRLGVKIQNRLMAGTPYADDGLGTLTSFDTQIGAPQLQAFYKKWYHPNNAVYVIAGDVDPGAAVASVQRFFGEFPQVPLPGRPAVHLRPLAPATFTDTTDEGSTLLIAGYRFPGLTDSDYAASVVLADVLNNRRGAAYDLVASGKLLDVETDTTEFPSAGIATITAHASAGTDPKTALAGIEAVVARYRSTGVPSALVDSAKQREFAQFATAGDSIRSLAELWSQALTTEGRTPAQDLAAIARVRTADVDRVLRTYLVNSSASLAYAVPKHPGDGDAGGGAGGGGATETKSEPTVLAPLPPWAQSALDRLAPPVRGEAPTEFTLPSGLHVVVRPDHSSPSVAVAGVVAHDAGLEEPDGQAGVGTVVGALLPYGTTSLTRLQYQSRIDAISADVSTGFDFSLSTISSNFERGMTLLADDELHPALRADDFAIVRAQTADTIEGDATAPDHEAEVALASGLYPEGDPARVFASAANVRKLTLEDTKNYYTKAFRPDLTTIAIVGDVTPEAARATVERTFGSWTSIGPTPPVVAQPVRDNTASSTFVSTTNRGQDAVRLEETLALGTDDADVAPLELASTVLSGDFSSILVRDMRVTTGYVYYVGTALQTARARSVFSVRYGCAPENYAKAQSTLERDLGLLQAGTVDAERLQRAKSRRLSAYALSGESYASLAKSLASDAASGLGFDDAYRRVAREYATTPADLQRASRTWLRPTGFVRTIEAATAPAASPAAGTTP